MLRGSVYLCLPSQVLNWDYTNDGKCIKTVTNYQRDAANDSNESGKDGGLPS